VGGAPPADGAHRLRPGIAPSLTSTTPAFLVLPKRTPYYAYRAGAELAQILPEPVGVPLARGATKVGAAFMTERRHQIERNLRRVCGPGFAGAELRQAVTATFDSYGRYFYELFRLRTYEPQWILDHFHCLGVEHVAAGVADGRGAVLALPHLGNWDFAGAWLALQGYTVTVVAEPVEPPELFDWFAGVRRALGMTVVQLGPDAGRVVLQALRNNQIVCLLCDRDIVGDGIEVDFFGEHTTLPAGPATLALRTGAPLLAAAVYFAPQGGHHAVVMPPVPAQREGRLRDDVGRVTQELAYRFEELIRAAPDQWHLLQPNWPSDLATNGSGGARS
jgi:lauroyl/myristoyl acyltransferase